MFCIFFFTPILAIFGSFIPLVCHKNEIIKHIFLSIYSWTSLARTLMTRTPWFTRTLTTRTPWFTRTLTTRTPWFTRTLTTQTPWFTRTVVLVPSILLLIPCQINPWFLKHQFLEQSNYFYGPVTINQYKLRFQTRTKIHPEVSNI